MLMMHAILYLLHMLENTCKHICIMSTYVYWRVYCLLTVSTFRSIGPCRAMFFWNVRRPCGDAAWQLDDVSAPLKIFRFCQPFGSCGVLKKSDRKHLQNNAKTYLEIQTQCPKHVSIIVIMCLTCSIHEQIYSSGNGFVGFVSSDVNNLKALDGSTTNVARLCHVHKAGCTCIGVGCAGLGTTSAILRPLLWK